MTAGPIVTDPGKCSFCGKDDVMPSLFGKYYKCQSCGTKVPKRAWLMLRGYLRRGPAKIPKSPPRF